MRSFLPPEEGLHEVELGDEPDKPGVLDDREGPDVPGEHLPGRLVDVLLRVDGVEGARDEGPHGYGHYLGNVSRDHALEDLAGPEILHNVGRGDDPVEDVRRDNGGPP